MERKTIDAVVAGHICLDICPEMGGAPCRIEDIFAPGKLTNVGKAGISTGGAVSNTGIALAIMGFKTVLMAKTGKDLFGEAVLDIVKAHGAGGRMSRDESADTSYSIVLSPPGIDRMFLHNPGANGSFGMDDIDYDAVGKARVFHLGYPPLLKKLYSDNGRELKQILQEAKSLGAITSLDMSLPDPESPSGKQDWRGILANTLPLVDIFLPSAEEIFFMLRREEFLSRQSGLRGEALLTVLKSGDIEEMGEELLGMGAGLCLIKCGGRGIYFRSPEKGRLDFIGQADAGDSGGWSGRELWAPPFRVRKFVSALGAGDNAVAGFLGALLKGLSAESSLLAAAACGALNVESPEALGGARPWPSIASMLESAEAEASFMPGAGWEFCEGARLWLGPADIARGG